MIKIILTACLFLTGLLPAGNVHKNFYSMLPANGTMENGSWKNKKCAVVLTYDDAIKEHLDNALPVLDSLGLKATFYITASSAAVTKRLNEW